MLPFTSTQPSGHHVVATLEYYSYTLSNWVESVSNGERPNSIPAPDISNGEKVAFIKQYLKDDDATKEIRWALARKIEQGETLSINVKAA